MSPAADRSSAARPPARRGWDGLALTDSLHLAAAVEHGCTLFLTRDARLKRFPDIPVEIHS
jgi:predicted nucleic acid-binding protein